MDTGGTAPQADREAVRQYHKRLNEIDTEIAGADENSDAAEISRLQREKDIILAEARGGMGLGGKARPKSPNEKARSSVAKAIERVLDNCREKWNLPKLADHLDGHVERGLACSYRPSPSPTPDWQF